MLFRILRETFQRRKRRVGVAVLAVLMGASLAAALLTIATDIADKVRRELRAYGANILVSPQSEGLQFDLGGGGYLPSDGQDYLDEGGLVRLKTIFWRNNILGFAPFLSLLVTMGDGGEQVVLTGTWFDKELSLPAGTRVRSSFAAQTAVSEAAVFRAGVKAIAPWWKVQGNWVRDDDPQGALVGAALVERWGLQPGDRLEMEYQGKRRSLTVAGIVSTGGLEENQIFVSLPVAQGLIGIAKGATRVLVSALVTPKDKLPASIRGKKVEEMTPKEYETWYCTPIIESIATQVEEVTPGARARPIRQISEAEGSFVGKVELMILLITAVALAASALGVMTTMTTTVLERRGEIGLMKAIGADNGQVAAIFLTEAAVIGLLGGLLGYAGGVQLAAFIGQQVFNTSVTPKLFVLPATLMLALGVGLLGSALPVRSTVQIRPVALLRGN